MRKYLLLLIVCLSFVEVAYAEPRIAVVDINQVVENSSQVKLLKSEHQKKLSDIEKIVVKARNEISKEKSADKILALEDKYTKEFNNQRELLQKDYNNRLSKIEQSIKKEITQEAQKEMYDYVFAKSIVLYGGTDITKDIISKVK